MLFFFFFFLIVVVITMVLFMLFEVLSYGEEIKDNSISCYECGFDPMMEARINFSYRFFLISILFLIFDVEIALILPIPYLIGEEDFMMYVVVFFFILLVGLLYEYFNGMLSWM